jgi:flagellar motility protein MotE (MotC chaperone)
MRSLLFILTVLVLWFLICLPAVTIGEENAFPPPSAETKFSSVEERRLLSELQQERQTLDRERQEIVKQKNELKRLEREVYKELEELTTIRKSIDELLIEKSLQEQKRIKELAKMYERMDPRNAAHIFIGLDKDLAIAILARMKTKATAKIMDNMDKRSAVQLTAAFSKLRQKNMGEEEN